MKLYKQILLDNILRMILLFAGFVEVIKGFFKYDLIEKLDQIKFLKYSKYVVYVIILIAVSMNITNLTYYLPFLGNTAYPTGMLREQYPSDSNFVYTLNNVKPNTKILFWGSENPSKQSLPIETPWEAYNKYTNSGVTVSNNKGVATLKLIKPVSYKVPNGQALKSHVHYREVIKDGMLGPVETVYIS